MAYLEILMNKEVENRVYLNTLYDIYGKLLTKKQQEYFEEYYVDNLTLKEISENRKISRNAVHNQLKETIEKLLHFEEILNILAKKQKILFELNKIDDTIKIRIEKIIE